MSITRPTTILLIHMKPNTQGLWLDSDGSNLFLDDPETWASVDEFVRETVQTCASGRTLME